MEATEQRVFRGSLSNDGDDFLLRETETNNFNFLQVTLSPTAEDQAESLAEPSHQVSSLGHLGEPAETELGKLRSVIAEKIVSHEDIAQQAFGIYESGVGGSAFDHWLLAERTVLSV
jgi:hypothetical protein